jgi:hypothetical protein
VGTIYRDKMAAVLAGFKPSERPNGFGIYGKNFIWKNMEDVHGLNGELSINPQKIEVYTKAFNKAWAKKSEIHTIPADIVAYCRNKKIDELSELIKLYKLHELPQQQ